jgi:hypothetical protein
VPLDPLHHTIIATDVEKSSSRTDALLVRMRRDLREILGAVLGRQGLDPRRLTSIDDGDGFRYLLPASVPPHAALDPFVQRLGIELRMHREAASAANRLRLRLAVHSGLLFAEDGGTYTGTPLRDTARLLDAEAGRELLRGHPAADLVVLVSDSYFHEVVESGTSLDPAAFQRIRVRVKETDRDAWAYLPGVIAPPEPAPAARSAPNAPAGPPPARSSQVSILGNEHVFNAPITGGDSYGR